MEAHTNSPSAADLASIKAAAKREFSDLAGVEGFGIGDGTLRIYVRNLAVSRMLPDHFKGADVDIVVTGDIAAQA